VYIEYFKKYCVYLKKTARVRNNGALHGGEQETPSGYTTEVEEANKA
jgi:hypothetical protein